MEEVTLNQAFSFVEKRGGGLQCCNDYRGLNHVTVKYHRTTKGSQDIHKTRPLERLQPSMHLGGRQVEDGL